MPHSIVKENSSRTSVSALLFYLGQNAAMRRFIAIFSIVLLAGCAAPSQQYPGSKKEGVFFTVPQEWREISFKKLQAFERASKDMDVVDRAEMVRYEVAYTTDAKLSAKDVFDLTPTDNPLAYLRVRDLYGDEINSISYNSLRSVLVPLARMVSDPQADDPAFDLIDDFEVSDKGGRSIRTIYRITLDGKEQVIDQTALTSEDRRILYVFVIRCTTQCYNKNKDLMTKISDSFSVKGPR